MRDQLVSSAKMTNDDVISFFESEFENENSGRKRSNEGSCPASTSQRRRIRESYISPSEIIIKVISALYGPCEYYGFNDNDDSSSPIPLMRDCTAFLLDLLVAAKERECRDLRDEDQHEGYQRQKHARDRCNNIVRFPPTVDGKIQSFVYLLPGVGTSSGDSASFFEFEGVEW